MSNTVMLYFLVIFKMYLELNQLSISFNIYLNPSKIYTHVVKLNISELDLPCTTDSKKTG